jgi:hypothetical protein
LAKPPARRADQVMRGCVRRSHLGQPASVGIPRSITQVRPALPYWASIRCRNARNVVLSEVLPGITS